MTGLPHGWKLAALNDLQSDEPRAITDGPFGSNLARAHYTASGPRVVRLQNIGDGVFNDAHAHISEAHFATMRNHEVLAGDLLVASLGEVLPRACIAPASLGPAIVKADCIRVRLSPEVDPRWVMYSMQRPNVRRWADDHRHGVGRPRLGLSVIRQIPVPLPPLDEQRRIVDILEDHLSRLDAATTLAISAARRLDILEMSGLRRATHGLPGSEAFTLSDVAEVRLGRQRSPKNHMGNRMRPYLRAANVGWDELRLDDVKQMQFTELESATYELCDGDILLTEASGSASEVGKSAIYEGEVIGVCFQNTLLRVRCHEGVDPKFVQLYLLAEARLGKFVAESRGVGIIHLGRARLASWPISLPAGDLQAAAVKIAAELGGATARTRESATTATIRAQVLRRALLAAAFSGRLTGRAVDMGMVEEMAGV